MISGPGKRSIAMLLISAVLMSACSKQKLTGSWYSEWSDKKSHTKGYMLDYFNSDNTYRSKVLDITTKGYYYEENTGTWTLKDNILTITILTTNNKPIKPRPIPSIIRFVNNNKLVFKLLDNNSAQEIIMTRNQSIKKLPIPTNMKRLPNSQ